MDLQMEPIEVSDYEKEPEPQIKGSVVMVIAVLVAMFDALCLYTICEDAASSLLWCIMLLFVSIVCCTVSTWTETEYGRSIAWLLAGLSGMTSACSFLVYVAIWIW